MPKKTSLNKGLQALLGDVASPKTTKLKPKTTTKKPTQTTIIAPNFSCFNSCYSILVFYKDSLNALIHIN